MDAFSHAFWGRGLFGFRGHPWLALFFGILPDLSSFGVYMIVQIIAGDYTPGKPPLEGLPQWLFIVYNTMHSFVTASVAIFLASRWRKDIAFAMCGWLFHIVLDFPFHTKEYFPTKIFYPISDFFFDGVSWGNPYVLYPNAAGLVVLYIWQYFSQRKRKEIESLPSE